MRDGWSGALSVALIASLCLNALQYARRHDDASSAPEPRTPVSRRRLSAELPLPNSTMLDCASVACPRQFQPSSKVDTGMSVLLPYAADSRFRLHPPKSMLELTRLFYGPSARLGEPYLQFTNPFQRQPNLKYEWTQLTAKILDQAWDLLPARGSKARLVVEVGSFIGRSSSLIGNWLRQRDAAYGDERVTPLLCIDTWLGDVGMLLGQIYPQEMGRHFGQATLYHVWLLNMMAANLTERVLPLVAPSLLGARVLDFLRVGIDVIYLDSAHELRETFIELTYFWPLLRPGGMLIGDDFNWRAVAHDVLLFARTHGLSVASFDDCHSALLTAAKGGLCVWYLQKPANERVKGNIDRRPQLHRR